jgi:hypothetical protein
MFTSVSLKLIVQTNFRLLTAQKAGMVIELTIRFLVSEHAVFVMLGQETCAVY